MEENRKEEYKVEILGEKYSKDLKTFKVIFIGDSGVGKTSIVYRITKNGFKEDKAPTISVDLENYQVKINEQIIQIQFWDTCGNDEFASITPNLFKNASLSVIVYAINDRNSFNNIGKWNNILKNKTFECINYLIGNKCELQGERKIEKEEGEKLKKDYGNFKQFLEVSAKDGLNIDEFIKSIAISLFEKLKKEENLENQGILLEKEDFKKANKRKRKGCCPKK